MKSFPNRQWVAPLLMAIVSLVPVAAGANRLFELKKPGMSNGLMMARYGGEYVELVLHIFAGVLFALLVAYQTVPESRSCRPGHHRLIGRIAAGLGLIAALSGLWLIVGYPMSPLATQFGDSVRVFFDAALGGAIGFGVIAARRRDIIRHRAWMIRAFTIAIAGSTQAILIGTWFAIDGEPAPEAIAFLQTIGFLINFALAELRIHLVAPQIKPLASERITP